MTIFWYSLKNLDSITVVQMLFHFQLKPQTNKNKVTMDQINFAQLKINEHHSRIH